MGYSKSRQIIVKGGLLQYLDVVSFSDEKKAAITFFAEGKTLSETDTLLNQRSGFTSYTVKAFLKKCSKITGVDYMSPEYLHTLWRNRFKAKKPKRDVYKGYVEHYWTGKEIAERLKNSYRIFDSGIIKSEPFDLSYYSRISEDTMYRVFITESPANNCIAIFNAKNDNKIYFWGFTDIAPKWAKK